MTAITRAGMLRSLFSGLAAAGLLTGQAAAQTAKKHRVVLHVDKNDRTVMTQAFNNARNIFDNYRDKHEDIEVEFVA
jgi:hypothetical protein